MNYSKSGLCTFKRAFIAIILIGLYAPMIHSQPLQMTQEFQDSRQLLAQGSYNEAVDKLKSLLGTSKHYGPAMIEIGKIRMKQAEYEMSSALAHFSEAADSMKVGLLDNKSGAGAETPKILYDLGRVYEERLKNYPEAIEVFERVTNDYPGFLSIDKVYFHLATCYELTGQRENAAEVYKKIVAEFPYSTFFKASQEKMKELAIGTGQQEGAMELQEELVEDSQTVGQEAKANLDLGDMRLEAGDFSQAEKAYRDAINSGGGEEVTVTAYRKLINLLDEKQKDYEGAAKTVEEMIGRYPDHPGNEDYVYRLGRIYEEDLQTLKTTVIDGKVRYRKSSENVEKALNFYNSVTEKYPDADVSADAFLRKGELYEKELRDYGKAKESYREFLRRFPNHYDARKIQERLDEIENY